MSMQQTIEMMTEVDEARMRLRSLSKMCVAFANLQADEECWNLAYHVASGCDEAMGRVRNELEKMRAECLEEGKHPAGMRPSAEQALRTGDV